LIVGLFLFSSLRVAGKSVVTSPKLGEDQRPVVSDSAANFLLCFSLGNARNRQNDAQYVNIRTQRPDRSRFSIATSKTIAADA